MKVEFYGLLPDGADLFPGDYLDATGRLAEVFGFTGIAHLSVSEGKAYAGDDEAREFAEAALPVALETWPES